MSKKDKGAASPKGRKRDKLSLLECDERFTEAQLALLATARDELEGRVSDKRLEHSVAVSETAVQLAEEYGVDLFEARMAGLVHDWNKGLTDDELLEAGHAIDFPFPEGHERDVVSLMHAPTGAADLAKRFPELSASILQAVARHTAGGPDMTDLDMVIYVSDMIEPGRSWEGVEDYRDLVGKVTLSELYCKCYASTMASLFERGRYVYPPSVTIWNDLVS